MILVFGSINMDLIASVAAIPRPGETVLSPGYRTLFGGKGANQAVAAARMGGDVAMVGRVGNDGFGASCRGNLAANGVATEHVVTGPEPTGCAFITVDAAGENAITVASGANGAVTGTNLPATLVQSGTVVVMQMEVPLAASLDAARKTKAAGGRVVWNFAPAPPGLTAPDLRDILAATDVFVVNEIEAMMAADALGGAADFKDAARLIAQAGSTICVVTAGAAGAFACEPDGTRHHAPALPVTPADTTGAGDTFVGVFAAELARHGGLDEALRRACAAASIACLAVGAQDGMPTRRQLEDWLTTDRKAFV